ncbi:MAG: 2-dehydropantoate 2-reductase [Rhodospirillales bacterium]|nr:2-dehydropantoate 2-reductase [Rhodospirillales bacterium]
MKFIVMGAGGVGGYFGARLAASGHDVGFVARGRHLRAMQEHGLKVRSVLGDIALKQVHASNDPAVFASPDYVLFTVKSYDCEQAAALVRPALSSATGVVPLLNGIEHIDMLRGMLGPRRILGGVAQISALIEAPGVIRHFDRMQTLRIGEMDNSPSKRVQALREACTAAGIDCPPPDDIEYELWQKAAMICTLAGANCLTRLSLGPCRANPATRAMMARLTAETVAVARALGVSMPDDQEARTLELLDRLPATMKASLLVALERRERLEISALSGAVERLGRQLGIDTPTHRTVYAALAPHEHGLRGA